MKHSFALADFVPYLLNRAGVRIGLAFGRELEPLGVSLPMWRVMVVLWENGDQRLGDLSERTSIEISTLSRLLLTLQRNGLIVRRRSDIDGRALNVSLAGKGRAITERIIPIASHYEDVAVRGISASDLRRLRRMLVTLFCNIESLEKEVSARNKARRRKKSSRS